jgi:hypothetical protein
VVHTALVWVVRVYRAVPRMDTQLTPHATDKTIYTEKYRIPLQKTVLRFRLFVTERGGLAQNADSNLMRITLAILTEDYHVFPDSLEANAGIKTRLGHGRFVPGSINVTFHHSFTDTRSQVLKIIVKLHKNECITRTISSLFQPQLP